MHQYLIRISNISTRSWRSRLSMFPAVCHQFANAMGRHTLIPATSLDEATRIEPFNIVAKKHKRRWIFFHKTVYTVYGFPLNDMLQNTAVFESKLEETKFCSYNPESTYSLSGKFGADILKDLMDAKLSASDNVTISAKLGEITLTQVADQNNFMTELMSRKINLDHPFIKQLRKDDNIVLCVIRGVVQVSDKAEIKRVDNLKEDLTVEEKVPKVSGDIEEEASENKTRDITLEKGTSLAYKVWELKVDVDTGKIVPMMTGDLSGGFKYSTMDGASDLESDSAPSSSDISPPIKLLEDQLKPLILLPQTDRQNMKSWLTTLMKCQSDIILLSKLIDQAESGNLDIKENQDIMDKNLVNKETVCSILNLCGGATIIHEGDATPLLTAVGYVIDAMTELESQDLEKICQCSEEQKKAVTQILKSSLTSKMPIAINEDLKTAIEAPADTLLKDIDFTLYIDQGTIVPPKDSSNAIECLLPTYLLFNKSQPFIT